MKPSSLHAFTVRKVLLLIPLYAITIGMIAATIFLAPREYDLYPLLRDVILFFASVLLSKYLFYMIVSPWHGAWAAWTKRYWRIHRPHYHPKVSVLIPSWNEEVGILSTVKSVLASAYDRLEVVVVNDGSTDGSDLILQNFKAQYDSLPASRRGKKSIEYRYQANGGKGSALNNAISAARGSILVSIDADCVVEPDAIGNFVEYFRNPNTMAAVGNVKIGNTQKNIGLVQAMEFLFSFYFKKADSLMGTIYIIGGAAGAFRKEVFTRLGGYNTKNITEDIELSMRIQDAGGRIVYADNAVVHTEGASELQGLMQQRLRWKRGRFETFKDYRHMFFSVNPRHNKMLTCAMLPLALFSELQLFLEFWFLGYLYSYALLTGDFSSFISGIIVVSSMFVVQMMFDDKSTRRWWFLALAPVAWLLFYMTTYVEADSLVRSINGFVRKQEIRWQQWQRVGVHG